MLKDQDPLFALVATLDRAEPAAFDSASRPAQDLLREIVSTPRAGELASRGGPPRARGTRRTVPLLVAAALLAVGATSYAASTFLDTNEALRSIDQVGAAIPLPPGGNFDAVRSGIAGAQAQIEQGGVANALAFAASCQWYGYWLDGHNRGDQAQVSVALQTITKIPEWPQIQQASSGPGSMVEEMQQLSDSATQAEAAPIRQFLIANCSAEPWFGSTRG